MLMKGILTYHIIASGYICNKLQRSGIKVSKHITFISHLIMTIHIDKYRECPSEAILVFKGSTLICIH